MPKKTSAPATPATQQDIEEIANLLDSRLADADSLSEEVVGLRGDIEGLTKIVDTLVQTVDDLRSELEWALKNHERLRSAATPLTITSMPRDPLAEDFGSRLNRFTPKDLPADADGAERSAAEASQQAELF